MGPDVQTPFGLYEPDCGRSNCFVNGRVEEVDVDEGGMGWGESLRVKIIFNQKTLVERTNVEN